MGASKLKIDFEDDDDDEMELTSSSIRTQDSLTADDDEGGIEFAISEESAEDSVDYSPKTETAITIPDEFEQVGVRSSESSEIAQVQALPSRKTTGKSAKGAYKLGDELRGILRENKLLDAEFQSKIKLEILQRISDYKAEQAQKAKLLEYRVNKLLARILPVAPKAKKEILMIKKILNEHAQVKKRTKSKKTSKQPQKSKS